MTILHVLGKVGLHVKGLVRDYDLQAATGPQLPTVAKAGGARREQALRELLCIHVHTLLHTCTYFQGLRDAASSFKLTCHVSHAPAKYEFAAEIPLVGYAPVMHVWERLYRVRLRKLPLQRSILDLELPTLLRWWGEP